jgi:hypothetical protein
VRLRVEFAMGIEKGEKVRSHEPHGSALDAGHGENTEPVIVYGRAVRPRSPKHKMGWFPVDGIAESAPVGAAADDAFGITGPGETEAVNVPLVHARSV